MQIYESLFIIYNNPYTGNPYMYLKNTQTHHSDTAKPKTIPPHISTQNTPTHSTSPTITTTTTILKHNQVNTTRTNEQNTNSNHTTMQRTPQANSNSCYIPNNIYSRLYDYTLLVRMIATHGCYHYYHIQIYIYIAYVARSLFEKRTLNAQIVLHT